MGNLLYNPLQEMRDHFTPSYTSALSDGTATQKANKAQVEEVNTSQERHWLNANTIVKVLSRAIMLFMIGYIFYDIHTHLKESYELRKGGIFQLGGKLCSYMIGVVFNASIVIATHLFFAYIIEKKLNLGYRSLGLVVIGLVLLLVELFILVVGLFLGLGIELKLEQAVDSVFKA